MLDRQGKMLVTLKDRCPAGEDFYHVLSGLRAIHEAIMYMHMKNGDRIGHATVASIDIGTWISIVGKSIFIPKGEYLDDLVFAFHLIGEMHVEGLDKLLPCLEQKMAELSLDVYGTAYPAPLLVRCWKLREFDPREKDRFTKIPDEKELVTKYNDKGFRKK